MPLAQEVERIFKLRQQFKECGMDSNAADRQNQLDAAGRSKNSRISQISELIKKFKE